MLVRIVFFVFVIKSNCFNIDIKFPIVFSDPAPNSSSYFGYSLVLYPEKNQQSWVLVGAPKAEYEKTNVRKPGVCFKCKIEERKCTVDEHIIEQIVDSQTTNEKFDDAWIGGSMDINYKHNRIATCAHRRIDLRRRSSDGKVTEYYMKGSCYWFHPNDNGSQRLYPLTDKTSRDVYPPGNSPSTQGRVYYYGQGQAGFSLHMPSEEKQLLLGAPGVYNWDGTSILYIDLYEGSPMASRLQNKRSVNRDEFGYFNIANTIDTVQTGFFDLSGYSGTSGYFYGGKTLYYVSGAPKSRDYRGQVLIYKFHTEEDKPLIIRETRQGQQFGEYFGSSVTAGDINNDGYDDLIVGAPFHKAERYNEGKAYIFMGSLTGLSKDAVYVSGKATGSQFGTCLQYLGDINSDGYGDVAIAAPYEDERRGVVYIYRGRRQGLVTTPVQRIEGKTINPNILGFGISISRAVDIDSNECPDIAIGAYKSGHVALFRTRPVVKIYHSLTSLSPHLDDLQNSFEINTCFWFDLKQEVSSLTINRILTLDQQLGRAKLKDTKYKESITLLPEKTTCHNITVLLELQEFSANKQAPITVSLDHELVPESNQDNFCKTCPVYDKYYSTQTSNLEVPFALDCGSDNICSASLNFEPKLVDIGDDGVFILGSKDYLTLQTVVENEGERAYLTELIVTVPEIITFRSTPSACREQNTSSVVCSVENPLRTGDSKVVTLDLDMTNLNKGKYDDSLEITVMVLTNSENDQTNIKHLMLNLRREADVTISGKSDEQSYSYRNIDEGTENIFSQTYNIEKSGRSPLNELQIEIAIPHKFRTKKGSLIEFIGLYAPTGNIIDRCTSTNLKYLHELKKDTEGIAELISEDGNVDNRTETRRVRRQSNEDVKENIVKENEFVMLRNRTFYINCSVPEIVCSSIICTTGAVTTNQVGDIQLKMLFNISAIKQFFGQKDVVQFTTHGTVRVINPINFIQSGDNPDYVDVTSIFVGDSITQKVELWIIILSVIVGLLVLLLLIMGLIKAGFFKRTRKEELEQLKKEMEHNDENEMNILEEEE